MKSDAILSKCGLYRYRLTRRWADGPTMCFIMLNPSTADAQADDPTIRRCIGFAKRENCGALMVANLFALRSTDPENLICADDPVGPDNDHFIQNLVERIDGPIVAAWGSHAMTHYRASDVIDICGSRLKCLGKTKHGSPRHPLYVKGDAALISLSGTSLAELLK